MMSPYIVNSLQLTFIHCSCGGGGGGGPHHICHICDYKLGSCITYCKKINSKCVL